MIEEYRLGCGLLFRGRWPRVTLAQTFEPVKFGYQRVRLLTALLGTTCNMQTTPDPQWNTAQAKHAADVIRFVQM